jgi:2-hydroxychromene-2-carboxylate isomerase
MARPVLYFDLASPYAYLAVARAADVLGVEPELEPILLGAIFRLRGHDSWAHTAERDRNVAEIEQRACRYGLPPLVWPARWPANSLAAMRAATWAKEHGAARRFADDVYRRQFAEGADIADLAVLAQAADAAGLPGAELAAAIAVPRLKLALRAATDAAWSVGVSGAPCVRVGADVFYGDDRLEDAAAALG